METCNNYSISLALWPLTQESATGKIQYSTIHYYVVRNFNQVSRSKFLHRATDHVKIFLKPRLADLHLVPGGGDGGAETHGLGLLLPETHQLLSIHGGSLRASRKEGGGREEEEE